jgi:hypothetical protein
VYSQSQPGLWAAYLAGNNRGEEAARFAQEMYPMIDPSERPFLPNAWGNAISEKGGERGMREALGKALHRGSAKGWYGIGIANGYGNDWHMSPDERRAAEHYRLAEQTYYRAYDAYANEIKEDARLASHRVAALLGVGGNRLMDLFGKTRRYGYHARSVIDTFLSWTGPDLRS